MDTSAREFEAKPEPEAEDGTQGQGQQQAPLPGLAPRGPSVSFPAGPLLGATLLTTALFAGGSWLTLQLLGGATPMRGPVVGVGLGLIFAGSLLLIRPWKPRPLVRWPALWLAGRLACFVGVLVFAVALLYSAPQSERMAVGLLVLAGYALLFTAESAAAVRALSRMGASPSG